jgi:hypothetical protein
MTAASVWIRSRLGESPPRLLKAMLDAVPAGDQLTVAEALARGAERLYASVMERPGGREDALDLLAADALFTHSFEAQAEADPSGLASFASRWSGRERLGRLVR